MMQKILFSLFFLFICASQAAFAVQGDFKSGQCYFIQTEHLFLGQDLQFTNNTGKAAFCLEKTNDTQWHLRAPNGQYVTATKNGSAKLTDSASHWESFTFERNHEGVAVKTVHTSEHAYLGIRSNHLIEASAPTRFGFQLAYAPVNRLTECQCYYIKTANNLFLAVGTDNLPILQHAQTSLFCMRTTHDKRYFLQSTQNSQYLGAGNANGSIYFADKPSGWESFSIEFNKKTGSIALKTAHNTFIIANTANKLSQQEEPPSPAQSLYFIKAMPPTAYHCTYAGPSKTSTHFPPNTAEKVVWTFWDKGAGNMPEFYKLNVEAWHKVLGDSWTIRVLNVIENDPLNYTQFISPDDLPKTFQQVNPVVKSDMIRIALLKKYGGVWMDASNILLKPIDDFCWNKMEDGRYILCGFYNPGWGSDHLGRKDYFENWFIAASNHNPFVAQWQKVFNAYWDDRVESTDIVHHPLYKHINLDNFNQHGLDLRNYLTQHIAFRKLLEHDNAMRAIWKHDMLLYSADGPFLLTSKVGWDAGAIAHKLLDENDTGFVDELFATTPLMKFTSSMASGFRNKSRNELLNPHCTLGQIYKRLGLSS